MLIYAWSALVFLLGASVGSFINVCTFRLPLQKSLFWPGSRCGHCYQPIRWYDNLPLISYLWLRGRCRTCGVAYGFRYFAVELLTALGFLGLFWLEVVANIHNWVALEERRFYIDFGYIPWIGWITFLVHATLFSFLLTASICDLDRREVPPSLTLTGTVIGLAVALFFAWPWPQTPAQAMRAIRMAQAKMVEPHQEWWLLPLDAGPASGLYPWPFWGPLPAWAEPGGNWQTGLATGLLGLLVGTVLLRTVRTLFSRGLGSEALGLGDADLMMMVGSFMGWQPVVVAFFISPFAALPLAAIQVIVYGDRSMPFVPALALASMTTLLAWERIVRQVPLQTLLFWDTMMISLGVVCAVFMLIAGYLLRIMRGSG
jgi:leader peptidase (prepilin peptidase)/N-methyltransferase